MAFKHPALLALAILIYGGCFPQLIVSKECAHNSMDNGAGYIPHETDCDKFIQCQYNRDGVLEGQIRKCAFSTYWNNDQLTCTPAVYTHCPTDKCQGQLNGIQYRDDSNCRGYWSCRDGKSVAKCCPQGQYYKTTLGCVDSDNHQCKNKCFNDILLPEPEVVPESEQKNPPCDKQPIFGNPYVYQATAAGLITVTMPCPIGTVYNHESCACIHEERFKHKNECKRELYLSFDDDGRDESGNNNYVLNENVTIENGVAKFSGINSRLVIPRFNNMDNIESLFIRVKYSSRHTNSGHARAIISNSDCLSVPSILLAEDDINTYYGVGTTQTHFIYVHIPQHYSSESDSMVEKKLEYKFTKGKLQGADGYSVKEEYAPGYIRNTPCALHVGYAESFEPFVGEINELEVFLCDPNGDLQG